MFSYKNSFIMFPISMLLLLIVGCQDASLSAEEPAMLEETLEAVEEFITEEAVENLARRGPSDRLPGSLQWGSIIIFKNGEDFILDYPDKGLRAVNSVSITSQTTASGGTGSTGSTGSTSSTSGSTGTTSSTSGGTVGGSTTIITSGGGVTMEFTVEDDGSGDSGLWFEQKTFETRESPRD